MSGQGAKKKRLGSRRANRNESSTADKFHITDSTSLAPHPTPEEGSGSLNALSNPDVSEPETKQPPSLNVQVNRRNKGRQNVQDSETQPYLEPEEEDEEEPRVNKTLETTQLSVAIQLERKEEESLEREHDISKTVKSSLCSATKPDYYSEVKNLSPTNCPEGVTEISFPKNETKLEGTEKSATIQSEMIKEYQHDDGISALTSSSVLPSPSKHQQLINVQPSNSQELPNEELYNMCPVEEMEGNKRDDTDLFTEDGNSQASCQSSKLHVESVVLESIPTEMATDRSTPREMAETECSIEQALFSSPKEELSTNEEKYEIFNLSEVRDSPQSEDVENKDHEDVKLKQMKNQHQNDDSLQSLTLDATESTWSRQPINQAETRNTPNPQHDDSACVDEQTNTGFNPSMKRRKLGSSRRSKGRQQVKESKEEVSENTKNDETSETITMSLTTEVRQEEESEHDIQSVSHDSFVFSVSTSGYSSEVQDPSAINHPETDLESLNPKNENLQEDVIEEGIDFKVEMPDTSVKATVEGLDQSGTVQSEEVRGAHLSVNAVENMAEDEIKPTQIQEILQSDYQSEHAIDDVTDASDSKIISGNVIDQAEITNTYQSELSVKSSDDSAAKQDVSNPDDKQVDKHTKEQNSEALDQKNEDDHVFDFKQSWTNNTEKVDHELEQMLQGEGQVGDDAEQTVHRDKEGVLSVDDKSKFSFQTLTSETNYSFDSQHQDTSTSVDEQTEMDFELGGNRRELVSSHKNEEREKVGQSKDKVSENTSGDETPETITMSLTETRQEELIQQDIIKDVSHDSSEISMSTLGSSSKIQNLSVSNYPETELESLNYKSENLQEDEAERETDFKMEDKSVEATLKGLHKSDTFQSEEVRGAHHSEDAVKNMTVDEVKPTQIQEILQIDYTSVNVIDNTTDDSEIISGTLIEQAEITHMYQSELVEKCTDGSATMQESSNSDDKQSEHHSKEAMVEVLDQRNEDCHSYHAKEPQICDVVSVYTALAQEDELKGNLEDIKTNTEETFHQEKEECFSEMDENKSLQTFLSETPFDGQPQDNSVGKDEKTDSSFHHRGNRRKFGSSRRHRRHVKDSITESYDKPVEEADGKTGGNEPGETTKISLTIETADQETVETVLEGIDCSDTSLAVEENDQINTLVCTSELSPIRVYLNPTLNQQVIGQSHCRQIPDEELSNMFSEIDAENKERDELTQLSRQDANLLMSEQPVCPVAQEISKGQSCPGEHTEPECSTVKEIVFSPENELPTKEEQFSVFKGAQHSEDAGIKVYEQDIMPAEVQKSSKAFSGNLINQREIRGIYKPELAVHSTDDSLPKQNDSDLDNKPNPSSQNNFEALDQRNEYYYVYDTKKPQIPDMKRAESSAEKPAQWDEKELSFEMEVNESSLQSLQWETHAPLDSQPQQNDTGFSPGGNTRKLGSSQEKSMETILEGMDKYDTAQSEDINVQAKQNAHFGMLTSISEFTSPTVDRQLIKSNSSEMPDEGVPTMYSVTETKEADEDTELSRQAGNLQDNNLLTDVDSVTAETGTDKINPTKHEVECRFEQNTKNGEQNECFNLSEVREATQLDDGVHKVYEEQSDAAQMHQLNYTSARECKFPLQTSETNAPLDSQPQDNSHSIIAEIHTGLSPARNRRKLGSSRRNKGRQHVRDPVTETHCERKEDDVENAKDDESPKMTKMSVTTETIIQETLEDLKSAEEERKFRSSENENTKKLPEEDSLFPQNVMNNITVVTTDFASSSDEFHKSHKDFDEKDKEFVKEPENLSQLAGYDTVQMNPMQSPQGSIWRDESDRQNISSHGDDVSSKSAPGEVLNQEEAYQVQNTEAFSCDKDSLGHEVHVQQTFDVKETEDCKAKNSMDVQGVGEVGECDGGIPAAVDASNNSQKDKNSDFTKNVQVKSEQKRRKMGSTRRSQLRKEEEAKDKEQVTEGDFNSEADVRTLDALEVVEEVPLHAEVSQYENASPLQSTTYKEQQEIQETSSDHDEGHTLQSSTSHLQSSDSNVIPGMNDLTALLPEQSASHIKDVLSPVRLVNVADIKVGEGNMDVNVEPSQLFNFTTSELQTISRRDIHSKSPPYTEAATNTGIAGGSLPSLSETTQSTQNDEEKPESAKLTQDQDTNKQMPSNVDEEAHLEKKNASPNLNSTNRRRKMGSTRKNLVSRTKGKDLHQKQEGDDEATEIETLVSDVTTVSVLATKEKALQHHTEDKDDGSEHRKEKIFETVEYINVGESQLKPLAEQTVENQASQGQPIETEHQPAPNYLPSTAPKTDTMSESAPEGRRRKMGSHRKSRGKQNHKDQTAGTIDAENERDDRGITSEIKATEEHREESGDLDKISEVDESDKKPPSSVSKASEHTRPVREKNPVPLPAEVHLGQESQKQFSLASNPRGADLRSNGYNVVMIGDSSVGKTSFMRRAQSGKFSFDLPASVGLDSCMWNVVVDGKPVILHVWDTAGQERFRSITRQIFHRAHAFLLMYDISSSQSFSAVSYWANCIQGAAAENVTVLLLGNKTDRTEREIKTQQGETLAEEYNFGFMECSAATGENVIQSLETVARMLSQRSDLRREATVLHKEPEQKKSSKCC